MDLDLENGTCSKFEEIGDIAIVICMYCFTVKFIT